MNDPDIVLRGPTPGVERRRRPVWLGIGVVLTSVGAALLTLGILDAAGGSGLEVEDALAVSTVPNGTATFTAAAGPYTLVLLTPGLENATEVERQVGATTCEVELADGRRATVDGGRQAQSIVTGELSTVGWFTAIEGQTTVRCTYDRRDVRERSFAVLPGRPEVFDVGTVALFGGIVVLLAGLGATARGWSGRTVISR